MKKFLLYAVAFCLLCYWCSDDEEDNVEDAVQKYMDNTSTNTSTSPEKQVNLDWLEGNYCGQTPYGTVWLHLEDGRYEINIDGNSYHEQKQEGRYTIGESNGKPCLFMREYGSSIETKFELDTNNHRVSLGHDCWAKKTKFVL